MRNVDSLSVFVNDVAFGVARECADEGILVVEAIGSRSQVDDEILESKAPRVQVAIVYGRGGVQPGNEPIDIRMRCPLMGSL